MAKTKGSRDNPKTIRKNKGVPKKLNEQQHLLLLQLVAEGLTTPEINAVAETAPDPFKVSPQLVQNYRRTYSDVLHDLRKELQFDAFTTGLALAANRVNALMKLALELEEDLFQKKLIWVRRQKAMGGGENFTPFEEDEFNKAEIQELRGLYDDIAKETGGRIVRQDITSDGKAIKGYVAISPDDWDNPSEPKS